MYFTVDFSDSAEDYGVQKFKEGFNAHVEEYIGDFIKPLCPLLYKLSLFLDKLKIEVKSFRLICNTIMKREDLLHIKK